jgi:hypothetical protein
MIRRSPEPAPAAPGEIRPPMPLEELDRWLRKPRQHQPVAESLSMLDGFVAVIVAGPATYEPITWLCPLLGVTRGAIDDGTTEEFIRQSRAARGQSIGTRKRRVARRSVFSLAD